MQLATLDNVTLLEGNHEANLRDYGLPDGVASKEFRMQTAPELAQAVRAGRRYIIFTGNYRSASAIHIGAKGFSKPWRLGTYAGEFIFGGNSGAGLRHRRV